YETDRYKIEKKKDKLVGYEKEHEVLKNNRIVLIQNLEKDFNASVSEGLDRIKVRNIIDRNEIVAIKINLGGGIHHIPSTYSDPLICEAIINKIKDLGANPLVCEANMRSHKMDHRMLKIRGYSKILRDTNTKFINLSNIKTVEMKCIGLDVKLPLPILFFYDNVKIISFAPPKPHWECGITCSQKNMYGAIAERRKSIYHRIYHRIDRAVAAAARLMPPDISICGCQKLCIGEGPHFGEPLPFNKLIIAEDMILCDKVCSEILRYPYNLVKYAMINAKGKDVSYNLHPESVKINEKLLTEIKAKTMQEENVDFWKKILYFQYFVPDNIQFYFYPPFEFLLTQINKRFFGN
ncbi:MAG: DUF362 domain-containing protein, partial [Candidatus Lokiarchaeota archaeon]|nr:DUF362 domain-containing protein [Candidatus Lokiarchaeota archaeon]